jgi:hypothetical protein
VLEPEQYSAWSHGPFAVLHTVVAGAIWCAHCPEAQKSSVQAFPSPQSPSVVHGPTPVGPSLPPLQMNDVCCTSASSRTAFLFASTPTSIRSPPVPGHCAEESDTGVTLMSVESPVAPIGPVGPVAPVAPVGPGGNVMGTQLPFSQTTGVDVEIT